jgi:hypothetical protein
MDSLHDYVRRRRSQMLDNEGNVVEEDAVIDKLEKASDYERGYARLDTKEVGLVDNLRKLAEGLGQKAAEMVSDGKVRFSSVQSLFSRTLNLNFGSGSDIC